MKSATDNEQEIDQQEVIEFLSSPAAFGTPVVKRIDTHISHVYLAGRRAYKLKRAVKFEFLDFSTLELREDACRREIAINKRYSSDLYLRVVPITKSPNGVFEIDGRGKPADWLVEMVRFDGQLQLDVLAFEKKLTSPIITELADVIAVMHKGAPYSLEHGGYEDIRGISLYIARTLRNAPTDHVDPNILTEWSRRFRLEVKRQAPLLNRRKRHKFVRHCHSDLHLANIILFNDQPTPFDAIEFNDDISWVDVLYDIAFTIMDLLHFQERSLANLLLNRYLEITRDYSGLALLPLFISLRAAIRAMATSFGQEKASIEVARNYLELASNSLSQRKCPNLIAIGGISGTGKSTLARSLAVDLADGPGAITLNSDAIRKRMSGIHLESKLEPDAYSSEVSERVYRRLIADSRRALMAGQTVVADATFLNPRWRQSLERLSKDLDIPLIGLWLEAPRDVLQERLAKRVGDVSDATFEIAEKQLTNVVDPQDWHRIDTSMGFEETYARSIEAIGA